MMPEVNSASTVSTSPEKRAAQVAEGACRAGAEIGDGSCVQQRLGRAGGQVKEQGSAIQSRERFSRVGAEPGDNLQPVEAQPVQIAGFDIQIRVAGVELVEDHGPQRGITLILFQVCLLHRVHGHGNGQQLFNSCGV